MLINGIQQGQSGQSARAFLTHRWIFFLEVLIVNQIMISMCKKNNILDRTTGLKVDQHIRHLPKLLYGQSVSGLK